MGWVILCLVHLTHKVLQELQVMLQRRRSLQVLQPRVVWEVQQVWVGGGVQCSLVRPVSPLQLRSLQETHLRSHPSPTPLQLWVECRGKSALLYPPQQHHQ